MTTPIRSRNDPSTEEETPPAPNPNSSNPSTGVIEEEPVVPETEEVRLRRYSTILEETLREQNATIQRLNETRATPPAPTSPPARDAAAERQEFYNDPMEATRRTVRKELEETVAPLLDFVKEMRGQGVAGRLKEQVKNDPRFSGMWDAAVEHSVDEALARVTPDQINEGTVRAAAVQAIGLKAMGFLENSSGNGNPQPAGERRVPATPPHMRPSAPPAPSARPAPKLRDLTENEERLRRENKMSKEDFLWWLEQPAGDITKGQPPSVRQRT